MAGTKQVDFPKVAGAKKKKAPASDVEKRKKRKRPTEKSLKEQKEKSTSKAKKVKTSGQSKRPREKMEYKEIAPTRGKKILSLVWDILFYAFLFLIIGGAIFFNFNDSPDKSFFGYRFMTVLTNSMAPNPEKPELTNGFVRGDIIILQQVNPEGLKEKDIITFYPVPGNTDAYLTHRVIKIQEELDGDEGLFITTQGDANSGADIPIRGNQVVGKVIFTIPLLGNFINFIRDNLVVVTVFIATLFGFFLTLKYYFGMNDVQKVPPKKKKRKKVSA